MKQIAIGAAALCTGLLLALSASAVDIQNADDEDYQVTVIEGGMRQALTLPGTSILSQICHGPCTLRIEGVGEVEADDQELVRIQDGEITKQPKED